MGEGIFKVTTVDNEKGTIEVTDKFLLYTGSISELWPLNSFCRYRYDSCWFEFEVTKNCPYHDLLPGWHRFQAQHLFDVVAMKDKNTVSLAWEGPVIYPMDPAIALCSVQYR